MADPGQAAALTFDETAWWGDCANSFHEEQKQLVYAARMGLLARWSGAHPPEFDLQGRSVVDIGGGPVSLLLKCVNRGRAEVVDPGAWPEWVRGRYDSAGILLWRSRGEDYEPGEDLFDEAWIYNVLTHVDDPKRVIANARKVARTIRLFEWIDMEPYEGHPHRLTQDSLDEWLGGHGFVTSINESGACGTCYYGVFRGPPR